MCLLGLLPSAVSTQLSTHIKQDMPSNSMLHHRARCQAFWQMLHIQDPHCHSSVSTINSFAASLAHHPSQLSLCRSFANCFGSSQLSELLSGFSP